MGFWPPNSSGYVKSSCLQHNVTQQNTFFPWDTIGWCAYDMVLPKKALKVRDDGALITSLPDSSLQGGWVDFGIRRPWSWLRGFMLLWSSPCESASAVPLLRGMLHLLTWLLQRVHIKWRQSKVSRAWEKVEIQQIWPSSICLLFLRYLLSPLILWL